MSNNMNQTNQTEPQIVTTGKIRDNNGGGECIHFHINLGLFVLKFIVNVPLEGQTEAPVYVKFRLRQNAEEHSNFLAQNEKNAQRNQQNNVQVMQRRVAS